MDTTITKKSMPANPMKRIATLFCFLLGCAYGFRPKRSPQLSLQRWTDADIFVGHQSIGRDTRCCAFNENDGRGRGRGRDEIEGRGRGRGRGPSYGRGGTGVDRGSSDAFFLFDRNNDNPTQGEVDAYFRSNPNPSPQQVVDILLRSVMWKKKKKIDVLSGDKLLYVISALRRVLSILNLPQLRLATIGILECLQVVPIADIEKSGWWYSFVYSLLSNSHATPIIMILFVQ